MRKPFACIILSALFFWAGGDHPAIAQPSPGATAKINRAWAAYRGGNYAEAERLYKEALKELAGKQNDAEADLLEKLSVLFAAENLEPEAAAEHLAGDSWQTKTLLKDLASRYGESDPRSQRINKMLNGEGEKPEALKPQETNQISKADLVSESAAKQSKPSAEPPIGAATPLAALKPGAQLPLSTGAANSAAASNATSVSAASTMPAALQSRFANAKAYYERSNYAAAQKELNAIVATGMADVGVHAYLADCLFNTRQYTKALREFQFVQNHAQTETLRRLAAEGVRKLKYAFQGLCPGRCLKLQDPGWEHKEVPGHPPEELWKCFPGATKPMCWSQRHVGQVIEYENGDPVNKGICPICDGTTRVPVLKDGNPFP